MKTQFFRFLVLSFAFFIFSASAFAQSGDNNSFEIPFSFNVGKDTLPAGKYEIKRVSSSSFLLRNETGNASVLVLSPLTINEKVSETSEKLVFNRYGNQYFLRQIFSVRNAAGRGINESNNEKMIRQNYIMSKASKPERVAVLSKK
jgi:hypothetical protein